jgi:aminoglycoside phosphotransferase (APT) family kinase protein
MDGIGGNRVSWAETPDAVRAVIEERLGAAVVEAVSQQGGFSPGMASRLKLADGRRVFAKAVGLERNPTTPEMYRREAGIAAQLPESAPVPKLLWSYDDGDWVVLVFEDIEGRNPAIPWRLDEWQRVHDAMVELSDALTPSPVDAISLVDDNYDGWRSLARDDELAARLDPWTQATLPRLVELEEAWPNAVEGNTLLHRDTRADNIILTQDSIVFVDWPHAAVGVPWIDLLFMLPSLEMQGGPEPCQVWESSPLAAKADPDAVNAALASLTGYFVHSALLPPPRNLPTIREFQRIQGEYALAWLRSRIS